MSKPLRVKAVCMIVDKPGTAHLCRPCCCPMAPFILAADVAERLKAAKLNAYAYPAEIDALIKELEEIA